MKVLKSFLVVVAIAVAVLPASAQEQKFKGFFGFGDSLADNGNVFLATGQLSGFNPAVPPSVDPHQTYFLGRFSNGPVAFDYLVNFLSQGTVNLQPFLASQNVDGAVAVDLAFGGSQTGFANIAPGGGFHVIGLKGQVALFAAALGGRRASAGALYGIISGSNDYLRALGGEEPADPSDVVQNIGQAIQDLYSLGARRVIVLNLPDLGKAPIVTVLAPQLSDELTQLSTQHNTLLGNKLKELGDSLSHLQIIDVDVNALLQSIPPEVDQTTPALDVLFPGTGMSLCLFVNPADCENAPDGTLNNPFVPYLFWDAEHPTTGIHLFLANHLLDRLTH